MATYRIIGGILIVTGTPGGDAIDASGAINVPDADNPGSFIITNDPPAIVAGGDGNDMLIGGLLKDTLDGGDGNDQLEGGDGNDLLIGAAGNDVLRGDGGLDTTIGGTGNDNYAVGDQGDVVTEAAGEGYDRIYASTSYTLAAGSEIEVLLGREGHTDETDETEEETGFTLIGNDLDNTIFGEYYNDSLVGNSGKDKLIGGPGADTLAGGTGDDKYYVNDPGDLVIEVPGEGTDKVLTNTNYALAVGSDVQFLLSKMGTLNTMLTGNDLNNTVGGAAGKNTLDGGAGADTLFGGFGNDLFNFHAGEADGDKIGDFVPGFDKLQFTGFGAGSTFAEIGQSNVWQISDGVSGAKESIIFGNDAHPRTLDFKFV